MNARHGRNSGTIFAVYCCFFASGAAGLAYEILWARILGLFFGHTVYAVTTVLAAFMGGLALGSRVIGRFSDRLENPLRLYALLELGTGLCCLAVPTLLSAVRGIYLQWVPHLPESVVVLTLARFAMALPVLLLPTTMMGGTIPAVCRHLIRSSSETGGKVGIAYGLNTLGGAFGALAVGYWLIPALGVRSTNFLGVAVNLLAGAAALLLSGKGNPAPAGVAGGIAGGEVHPAERSDRLLLWAFAVSGAVGMAFEIVWSRALVLVIGSSTYAYSAILTVFLLGIALGSILFARLKLRPSRGLFGLLQAGTGLSVFLVVPAFDKLPSIFFALFQAAWGSFRHVLALQFAVVCLVLLLPTILAGMTFPCVAGLCARRVETFGGELGRLYAWNTVGAIAGACAAGFFLVPALGAQKTLALGIAIILLSGGTVIWRSGVSWIKLAAPALAVVVVSAWLYPSWDRRTLSSGVFYTARIFRDRDELFHARIREILYYREGVSSTISVVRFQVGTIGLIVNGKVDASNGSDMETQVRLANIPILLHPSPSRIAVIGLGSGVTVGISSLYEAPSRIDVVELEEAVVAASDYFERENFGALRDPRVRLYIDDAASFMDLAEPGYDVIVSEPSNPWMAGVGNLYSREFYAKANAKLSRGGIYCQWLQGYALSPNDFRLVLRTFLSVFPESTLWTGSHGDFLLVGFGHKTPDRVDGRAIDARAAGNPRLNRSFRFLGDSPADSVLASFFLDTRELRAYAGNGELNTDDHPLLEFRAPASLGQDYYPALYAEMLGMRRNPYPSFFIDPAYENPESHVRLAGLLNRKDRPGEAAVHLRAAMQAATGGAGTGIHGRPQAR